MGSALVVWGGWAGHDPEGCAGVLAPWLESEGFKVTVSETLDAFLDKRRMARYSVIVPIWTMGEISGKQSAGLQKAVRNGAGLAGFHGGMCDAFRKDTGYQFMTGGQFVAHPGGKVRYKVKIVAPKDAVVRGVGDFFMTSEQYYMHTDPGNRVLATTTFSGRHGDTPWVRGTVMPVVWKRMFGKGRVFYSALGHDASEFDVSQMFEIMKRGTLWAARDR